MKRIGLPGWKMCRSWAGKPEGAFAMQALSSRSDQQANMPSQRSRLRQVQLQHHKSKNERVNEVGNADSNRYATLLSC